MSWRLLRRQADHRHLQASADDFSDVPNRYSLFSDCVVRAARFLLLQRQLVGATPMEYLTGWRMLLAGDRLKNSDDSISVIALSLGYESESAFGKAFKRVMGCHGNIAVAGV